MTRSSSASFPTDFSLPVFLERWCWLIVLTAAWSTWLLTVRNVDRIRVSYSALPMMFWIWFVAFYAVWGLFVVAAAPVARRFGVNLRTLHLGFGAGLGVFVAVSAYRNASVLGTAPSLDSPVPFGWLAPVCGGLILLAMAVLVTGSPGRRRGSRIAVLVGFGLFVATMFPWGSTAAWNPADPTPSGGPTDPRIDSVPLVLIGIDGADWDHLNPLIQQGRVPHLRRLKARGSSGSLQTLQPTKSPALWTTIATGFPPEEHGVQGFVARGIHGFPFGFSPLRPVAGIGFYTLAGWIQRPVAPVSSYLRVRPAYWNLAGIYRSPSVVVNWWGTWPVEPIHGLMVSERVHYRLYGRVRHEPHRRGMVFPPQLDPLVMSHVLAPGDVTLEMARRYLPLSRPALRKMKRQPWQHHRLNREFPYLVSAFETNRRLAPRMVELGRKRFGRAPDALVLFRATDLAKHAGLKYSTLVEDHLDASPEDTERYGDFVSNVYHQVDRAVGEILDEYETANVVIVSDHGFTLERSGKDGRGRYHHRTAPHGIWIAAGPAFKKGESLRLSIYDVLPLTAYAKGFAVARDWTGRVPTDLFTERHRTRHGSREIRSYGRRTPRRSLEAAPAIEESIEERLKGIGYLE